MRTMDSWEPKCADLEVLRRVKAAIREVVPDADVILYGSRARGDAADEYSDYDILVLVDGPANMALEDRMRDKVYPLQLEMGAMISFWAKTRADWATPFHRAMPWHKNVEREGVLL